MIVITTEAPLCRRPYTRGLSTHHYEDRPAAWVLTIGPCEYYYCNDCKNCIVDLHWNPENQFTRL